MRRKIIEVLALDLSSRRTGYVILFSDDTRRSGAICLNRGTTGGKRSPVYMARLMQRLINLSTRFKIRRVIFEETFAKGNAKWVLDSLQITVTLWAIMNNIAWTRISPTGWKAAVIGRNCSEQDYWKEAIKRFPREKHRFYCSDIAAAWWLLEYSLGNHVERQPRRKK